MLCSDYYPGCLMCTESGCLDCMGNFFLQTSTAPHNCEPCTDYLPGCAFCSGSSICLSCQNGFYISGNECESCSIIDGCLYCTDPSTCTYCQESYYLDTNACLLCSDAIAGCFACDDSATCISCQGQFALTGGACVEIKGEPLSDMPDLVLQSYYESYDTLKHILSRKSGKFTEASLDWSTLT